MSQADFSQTSCDALSGILPKVRWMHRVRSVRGLFADTKKPLRRFLLRCGGQPVFARIADYFDVEVDALVNDGMLGSLGLIYCLPTSGPEKSWVRQRIDQAAYLRHLLLEAVRPGTPAAGRSPCAVEIVFAVSLAGKDAGESACARIGEVLREITRDDSYLDAIGINVWTLRADSAPPMLDAAFRRAFSWLLHCAEAWHSRPEGMPDPSATGVRFSALELEDFRVAGNRRLELEPDESLHLVFGHNGSGKSSLCEALELVVTGKLQRLDHRHETEKPAYARILTNRLAFAQNRRAGVTLEESDGKRSAWSVEEDGLKPPLAPALDAASFRMDQILADMLAQGNTAARARLFLRAFFPAVRSELEKFDALEDRTQITFSKLPEHVRSRMEDTTRKFDPKRAEAVLLPLGGDTVNWEEVLKLLPLPAELLAALLPLLPRAAADALQRKGMMPATEMESLLPVLDNALSDLALNVEQLLQTLDHVVKLLEEYGEASVSSLPPETEELGDLVNRWLEQHALTDLLEKEDQISSTIESARQAGYTISEERASALVGMQARRLAPQRQELLEQSRLARDELRRRVTSFTTAAERAAQQARRLRSLAEFRPESLDQAAQAGVFGEAFRSTAPMLAAAVRQAFRERTPVDVLSGTSSLARVGEPGWGKELLAGGRKARQTLQAVRETQSKLANPDSALAKVWPTLRQLRADVKELSGVDQALAGEFATLVSEDSLLGQAVNEVMALFTPARWAYQDVVPSVQRQGRERLLEVRTQDKVHADLRLNTAELNIFSVALFLLCGRGIPNPLHLLILDDPLQNMDELTVTTVARGLGRLLRLWHTQPGGEAWQLLMLVHSETSLERFRNETPCAGYLLPWLSPHDIPSKPAGKSKSAGPKNLEPAAADPLRIKLLKSLLKPELQSLAQLIKPKPTGSPTIQS